jgi:RNA-dependent RNA polymerase
MVLEDRGASKDTFLELQQKVVAEARTANDSVDIFARLLESHGLSQPFRLASTLRKLNTLGLELNPTHHQRNIDTPFLRQARACAINHVLRAVKHDARIPIPDSYMLMGVMDEGPAYEKDGHQNVFKLPPGKIYGVLLHLDDSLRIYNLRHQLVFKSQEETMGPNGSVDLASFRGVLSYIQATVSYCAVRKSTTV